MSSNTTFNGLVGHGNSTSELCLDPLSQDLAGAVMVMVVTLLQRSWMLHFKETWWKCENATEAVLGWLRFVVEQYQGEVPNSAGINIKQHFYLPFFEEKSDMDE